MGPAPDRFPAGRTASTKALALWVPQSPLAMITGGPILKEKSSAANRQCQRLRRWSKPKKLRDVVIS
jgi:hypothetical protein